MSLLGKLIGKLIDNGGSPTPPPYETGFALNDTGGFVLNDSGGKIVIKTSENSQNGLLLNDTGGYIKNDTGGNIIIKG